MTTPLEKRNTLKKVLRALLISEKSEGMALQTLERNYRETEGRSIPLFGYPDTAALMNSLNDTVFTVFRQGQLLVYPVENEDTKHVADLVRNSSNSRRSKTTTRSSRSSQYRSAYNSGSSGYANRSNQNGYPNRVWTNNRSTHYQSSTYQNGHGKYHPKNDSYSATQYDRNKQSNEFSKNNVNTNKTHTIKANAIPSESNPLQRNQQSNGYLTPPKKVEHHDEAVTKHAIALECSLHSSTTDEDSSQREKIDLNSLLLHFDDEKILFDDLPTLKMTDIFKPDQSFRMYIAQIHSPYKFWFQLKEKEELIDSLMDHLDRFYYQDDHKIAKTPIPDEFIQIGMICAALFNSQWHRARIVDVFDTAVKVFYVDFGTVGEIFKRDVRFLGKQFAKHPAFAMRGCLDHIRPNDGIWTLEAMVAFNDHVQKFSEVGVLAKVTNVNSPEETLYLEVIDTTGMIDYSIANWLVESNFAYRTNKLLFDFEKRHYSEVYPPFEKLENGLYPSLQQMQEMLAENFDFLDHENSIIIPEMYGYVTIE